MLTNVWIVFHKETIDNVRDRRSLFMALIYPFIGALLLGLLLAFVGGMFKRQARVADTTLPISYKLPVHGAEMAPDLIAYLLQNGIEVAPAPLDPRGAVRKGDADIVLVLSNSYEENFKAMQPAKVRVVINASRLSTVLTVSRIVQKLRAFADEVSRKRLRELGVPQNAAQPLDIQNDNVGRS